MIDEETMSQEVEAVRAKFRPQPAKPGETCEYACMLRLPAEATMAEALAHLGEPANKYADLISHATRRAGVPETVSPVISLEWQQRDETILTGWCLTARCTMP